MTCMILIIIDRKTLNIRHIDYTSILHHKDLILYLLILLALYLFWCFNFAHELPLDFSS
jgi:hypothetical protein